MVAKLESLHAAGRALLRENVFAFITVFLVSLVIRARAAKVATGASGMEQEIAVAVNDNLGL